jgi:imidazolonepropionase-like amidohydrolase
MIPALIAATALVGGTLVDGFGGPPLHRSVVIVEGERIKAVGTVDTLPVPPGAEVVPTWGMTVIPGLWDMHVHLMIVGHSDYAHWDKAYANRLEDEIMPAAARQLLYAGVTSARDLGAPLEASLHVRDAIKGGKIPGPTMYVSGPFIQHEPYPGTEAFRWGVKGADDARAKVKKIASAGVNLVKLIDQDQMTLEEARAVVEEAHARKLPVVAHAHRPEEIRRGLAIGVDCFEHTGLANAPEYPPDVIAALRERTAKMALGPLFWTPTVEGLLNYETVRDEPVYRDDPSWQQGLKADTIADLKASIEHPDRLSYYQLTPLRRPTLARKIQQLRESGAVLLIGTDSGIPLNFHTQSTWQELSAWVNQLGIPAMEAIRAATYWPSVAMKVDAEVGTVSPGKIADIVAVKGDLLHHIDLIREPSLIVQRGKRIR